MLTARDELKTPAPDYPTWQEILRLLKNLPRPLGISRGARAVLITMIEHTPAGHWQVGGRPFIYAHNATLLEWTGVALSTLRSHLRELGDARLIVACDGTNGQRGRRWQGQDKTIAIGFDLSALRYRWADLVQGREEDRRRLARVLFMRQEIAMTCQRLRYPAHEACDVDALAAITRIFRGRLRCNDPEILQSRHDDLKAIECRMRRDTPGAFLLIDAAQSQASVDNSQARNVSPEQKPSKTVGYDAEIGTPYTDTPESDSKIVGAVAAQGRKCINAVRDAKPSLRRDRIETTDRSALRGFKATGQFLLGICPPLRDFCSSSHPGREELALAGEHLADRLGITHHAWTQGCAVLGRYTAAIAVIVMVARPDTKATILNPDAYFRALVDRGLSQALFLDRSLHALRPRASQGHDRAFAPSNTKHVATHMPMPQV